MMVDQEESKQIQNMRFISLMLVIYIHQANQNASGVAMYLQKYISNIVGLVAVPTFMLISSYLLYGISAGGGWTAVYKKRAFTVVCPYIIWNCIYIAFYWMGQTMPITKALFQNEGKYIVEFSALDWVDAFTGLLGGTPFVSALWYVRDLIVLVAVAPIIKKLIDKFPFACAVAVSTLWFIDIDFLDKQAITFFVLGYYMVKYKLKMSDFVNVRFSELVGTYVALSILTYIYPVHKLFLPMCILVGVVLICKISRRIDSKIATEISKYSFFIYAIHNLLQGFLGKLFMKFAYNNTITDVLVYLLVPMIVVCLALIIAKAIEKVCKPMYRILSGNR